MKKIRCEDCLQPVEIVAEPYIAFVCFECGKESVLSFDHDAQIQLDFSNLRDDGIIET